MRNLNTVMIRIKTGKDLRGADSIEVNFSQKGRVVLIKTGDAVMAEEDAVLLVLTRDETGMFEQGRMIPCDVTAIYGDGTQITCNIMYRPFDGIVNGRKERKHECKLW